MPKDQLEQLSLHTIMSLWPQTVGVFVDLRFHCVGCPISGFHGLDDAAREHGHSEADLRRVIADAIATPLTSADPARSRRQSTAGDADP